MVREDLSVISESLEKSLAEQATRKRLAQEASISAFSDNRASEFLRRLEVFISDFEKGLDDKSEVGLRLVNFGDTTFHLENVKCLDPSLICFCGENKDGNPVELIQHVSQINVLLVKVPREDPSKPKRIIGFIDRGEGE